jgi:hypothetical protein
MAGVAMKTWSGIVLVAGAAQAHLYVSGVSMIVAIPFA